MRGKSSSSRHSRQTTYIRYTTLKRSKRSLLMMAVALATVIIYVTAKLLVRRPLHVLVRFSDQDDEIREGFSVLVPKEAFRYHVKQDSGQLNQRRGSTTNPASLRQELLDNILGKNRESKWTLNPINKCKVTKPRVLVMIASHESMTALRDVIRKTWCKAHAQQDVVCIFLIGQDVEAEGTSANVTQEYIMHHDIIKQKFSDTFRNSTRKFVMGMEWMSEYCPGAQYVMKTEDDVIVNIDVIVGKLLVAAPGNHYFAGKCWSDTPNRNPKSRFYVSTEEFPGERYPTYCSRTGFIMSGDVTERMHEAAKEQTHLPLDDVFAGILLEKIQVKPIDIEGFLIGRFDEDSDCSNISKAATIHAHGLDVKDVWDQIQTKCKG